MAAPSFHSIGTQLQGTVSTASFAKPGTLSDGDVVLVLAFVDGAVTVSSAPSGFTQAGGSPVAVPPGAGAHSQIAYWKRVATAAGEPSTYDFVLSGSTYVNGCAVAYSGCVASGTPLDVTSSAHFDTNTTTTPAVSVTTTGADRLLVFEGSNWGGGAWTPPTGMTERVDTGDRVHTIADLAQAVAGSSGSLSATNAGSAPSTGWLGALLPVASGTTQNATATLTVTDALASAATVTRPATAASSTTATLTAAGAATRPAAAALAVTDTLAAAANATRPATAALNATGALTSTASATRPADAALTTTDTLAAAAAATRPADAGLSITATLTASATVTSPGASAVLTATATITAAVAVTRGASAALTLSASLSATASVPDTAPDIDIITGQPRPGWITGEPEMGWRWGSDDPLGSWLVGFPTR